MTSKRDRWNAALRDLATQLGERGIPLGVILDSPTLDHDPIECMGERRPAEQCEATTASRLQELGAQRDSGERGVLDAAGTGVVFDPLPLLCSEGSCPLWKDDIFEYSDIHHLTRALTRHLAPQLHPFVESLL